MTTNEIRSKFLEFFQSKEHTLIESDSVVPKDDPTVLFTTAGMQQFKRQFLGHLDGYSRACSSQKCIRTDDLDEVGRTDFHHTFFEMLGNFSFGDYFKKEAITWAWEFLTEVLEIPADRLWVSVYKDDTEAEQIWLNDIKLPKEKLFKLGDKSNFWPSNAKLEGPNGPCGPCSEIFYDYAPETGTTPKDPDDEDGRFCEVWNLVFTQFNRKEGGELEPLPNKNIDTGMGLERLSAVLQGKKSNFEADVFAPILEAIDNNIKIPVSKKGERNERFVIADHLRGIVFAINDGVPPSNEGRGYVVKKLIIDITDIAIRSGAKEPVIYKLIPSVVTAMGEHYKMIHEKIQNIADTVEGIERAYIKVRNERLPEFKKQIVEAQDADALGQTLFMFRDSYGLALSTMQSVVDDATIDSALKADSWKKYNELMTKQQEQSRKASKMTGDVFTGIDLTLDVEKTEFLGYEFAESDASVLKIYKNNEPVDEASEGDEVKIILDKTPFYAESGGQIGDTGFIRNHETNCEIRITDTQKTDGVFIHTGNIFQGTLKQNDVILARIDVDRRLSIMRNHTATHLLQKALHEILGSHIQQQGSYVGDDRLRFDFTHPKTVTDDEIKEIENLANLFIRACDPIKTEDLPIEEAKKSGALAFFAEKYGKIVRVVSIGQYSKEFCGGTHVGSTGQIGMVKVTNESAIAQGIRRIEARTGIGAIDFIREEESRINKLSELFKAAPHELVERAEQQVKRIKELDKQVQQLEFQNIKSSINEILKNADQVNDSKIITHIFKNSNVGTLRQVNDLIKNKENSFISILGAVNGDSSAVLVGVSNDLIKKGIQANDIVKEIATKIDGSGGGRPQLAQAGSKEASKIPQAIDQAKNILKEKI